MPDRVLVHCLTNAVAANLTANALLCVGASPLMAEAPDEMAEVAGFADALLVNLGMLTAARLDAARLAAGAMRAAGKPWVLDPVAVGAIAARRAAADALVPLGPALIKGNASEIMALAGLPAGGRGTDARHDTAAAVAPARALAARTGAVVAVTGAIDRVTDGTRVADIPGGHAMMGRVSGLGCVAGALAAAAIAAERDAWAGTVAALTRLGDAGVRAAAASGGPGGFAVALLDALADDAPRWGIVRDA